MKIPKFYEKIFKERAIARYETLKKQCKHCSGNGHVIISISDQMFIDCVCTKTYLNELPYIKAGVSVKHINVGQDDFKENFVDKTYERIGKFRKAFNSFESINVFFHPQRPSDWGMSSVGNFFIKEHISNKKTCLVISAKNLMDYFFAFDNDEMEECLEYASNVDALLIDDFGAEYNQKMKESSSFVAGKFNAFVTERLRNGKITMIASNIPLTQVKKIYASEIFEVVQRNFVAFTITCSKARKSAYEDLEVKMKNTVFSDCFDDIGELVDGVNNKQKPKRKLWNDNKN